MGTKRTVKDPAPPVTPVDRRALEAAVALFVTTFVVDDKRTQVKNRLLAGDRRAETLETLPRWIVRGVPLEGADRSPAGLFKRFGELLGVHVAEVGAVRTTIAGALERGRGTPTLFVADSGNVALITVADGSTLLCSRF